MPVRRRVGPQLPCFGRGGAGAAAFDAPTRILGGMLRMTKIATFNTRYPAIMICEDEANRGIGPLLGPVLRGQMQASHLCQMRDLMRFNHQNGAGPTAQYFFGTPPYIPAMTRPDMYNVLRRHPCAQPRKMQLRPVPMRRNPKHRLRALHNPAHRPSGQTMPRGPANFMHAPTVKDDLIPDHHPIYARARPR